MQCKDNHHECTTIPTLNYNHSKVVESSNGGKLASHSTIRPRRTTTAASPSATMLATALTRTCGTRVLTQGTKSVQTTAIRSFASESARRRRRHRIVDPPPPPYYNRMYGPHPYGYYRHYHDPWSFGRLVWLGLGVALIVRVASSGDCSCSKERRREAANSGAPGDDDQSFAKFKVVSS
ncbi:hypothetical protein FI667_g1961, partial [Globisporangium splendens]